MYLLTAVLSFFLFTSIAHVVFPWWVYVAVIVACCMKKEPLVLLMVIVAFVLIVMRQGDIQDCRSVAPADKEFFYDPVARVCNFM